MRRCSMILLVTGLAVVTLGILFGFLLFPHVLQKKIRQQIRLEEGGDLYNKWVDVTLPIVMKVYFFNVTNPKEFSDGGKPILEEVGPYVYHQKRQKVVTSHNPENDTLQFRPKITYFFQPALSNGRTEQDVIHFLNLPLVSVIMKAASMSSIARSVILDTVAGHEENEPLFVRKSVGELLFRGYFEPMISELSDLSGEEVMPNSTFGIYYGKNGTAQDLFQIYSGVQANEKFGNTISWNGAASLPFWKSQYCNMINGSDGSIFPPFLTKDRVLRIFSPDMCRSIWMTFQQEVEVKGIPAYRFTTPRDVLASPAQNRENVCYCTEIQEDEDIDEFSLSKCTKDGVFRIAPCRKGAPIVASFPHFFDGASDYTEQSVGLNPQKELHETFLSLEPNTGALLQASKRFQINVELKPLRFYKKMKKLPNMVLPILWVDESVSLNDETALMLKGKLMTPLMIGSYGMLGLISVGALLILIAIILSVLPNKSRKEVTINNGR